MQGNAARIVRSPLTWRAFLFVLASESGTTPARDNKNATEIYIYIYKYGHIERCKPAEREQSPGSRGRLAGWLSLDFAHHHLAVGIRHFAAAVEAAKLLQKAHAGKKKTQRTARP